MPKVEPFEYQKSTNIDEHNQIVNKINEIVDTSNDMEQKVNDAVDLVNELDKEVDKATSDISQLKISDAEHTEQIAHLDIVVDNHATEITALKTKDATIDTEISNLKTKDTQHDAEIQGLSESVVTDLVATFDNSSRKLSLSIEREQAESIDAVVTIPAGGGGSGGSYSAGDGIAISDANVISVDDTVGKKSEIVALQNATKPAIKAIEVTETAEKVSITTTALDDATKITEDIGVVSDTKAGIVTPELKKKWDSSKSSDWTEVDLDNIPTDWVANTEIKVIFYSFTVSGYTMPSSWKSTFSFDLSIKPATAPRIIKTINFILTDENTPNEFLNFHFQGSMVNARYVYASPVNFFNLTDTGRILFILSFDCFNATAIDGTSTFITRENIKSYIYKMYRRTLV